MLAGTIHRRLPMHLLLLAVMVGAVAVSMVRTDADVLRLLGNAEQMALVLSRLLSPDWSYLPAVVPALVETVQMAIAGTVLGFLGAIPIAFAATVDMTHNAPAAAAVRGALSMIRTVPDLLLAAVFVAAFGIGPFTGMLAIAVFTFGFVSKLVYESIETVDRSPIEAFQAVGGTRSHVAAHAVLPQIRTNVISYGLYALEVNIRASTVLGYIGAGGIGVVLQSSMSLLRYDRVSAIIVCIFAVVLLIDMVSASVRKRLL